MGKQPRNPQKKRKKDIRGRSPFLLHGEARAEGGLGFSNTRPRPTPGERDGEKERGGMPDGGPGPRSMTAHRRGRRCLDIRETQREGERMNEREIKKGAG